MYVDRLLLACPDGINPGNKALAKSEFGLLFSTGKWGGPHVVQLCNLKGIPLPRQIIFPSSEVKSNSRTGSNRSRSVVNRREFRSLPKFCRGLATRRCRWVRKIWFRWYCLRRWHSPHVVDPSEGAVRRLYCRAKIWAGIESSALPSSSAPPSCHRVDPSSNIFEDTLLSSLSKCALE